MIFSKNKIKNKKKLISNIWLKTILITLISLIAIDFFLFESTVIVDTKMENTLHPGDVVVINEWTYGKRLPITLFTLPLFRESIPLINKKSYLSIYQLNYRRLPAFGKIKVGDLMGINYPVDYDKPIDKKKIIIKRCIALPGDTLAITDKKVFINNKLIEKPGKLKFRYKITTRKPLPEEYWIEKGIYEGGLVHHNFVFDFYISSKKAKELKNDTNIRAINKMKLPRYTEGLFFFPQNGNFPWNLDYYGPVVIPYKGLTVNINHNNIALYKRIIDYFEENTFYMQGHDIYINNELAYNYTFKDNYYFVLSDNRDNAKDSRYWGFVPESHIVGKADFVLFTTDKGNNTWWSRFFKKIK